MLGVVHASGGAEVRRRLDTGLLCLCVSEEMGDTVSVGWGRQSRRWPVFGPSTEDLRFLSLLPSGAPSLSVSPSSQHGGFWEEGLDLDNNGGASTTERPGSLLAE